MRTGAYCGTVALASFVIGIIVAGNPVPAMYFGIVLAVFAGIVGTVFEERS